MVTHVVVYFLYYQKLTWDFGKKLADYEESISRQSATINPAKSMDIGPKKDVAYAAKLFSHHAHLSMRRVHQYSRHYLVGLLAQFSDLLYYAQALYKFLIRRICIDP